MRNIIKISFLAIVFFYGCASYNVLPQNITRYDKGVKILDSQKASSKVQIEVAQNTLGGFKDTPLVVYVGAEITSGNDVVFDTDNITVKEQNSALPVLTYEQLLTSKFDFTRILEDFGIPTPTPTVINNNIISPFFYFGRGGFLAYGPFFYPFLFDNSQNQQLIQEQIQSRKIMGANYLRKTTLSIKSKAKGGFIAIDPKNIKPGVITLNVILDKDTHTFNLDITKK